MTIFLFRDETEITYCNSRISRQDQDFRKLFLVVEREQMKLTLVENSLDREFLLNSVVGLRQLSRGEDNCSKSRYQNGLAEHTFCHFLHRVTLVETGVKELVHERPLHSLMVNGYHAVIKEPNLVGCKAWSPTPPHISGSSCPAGN